jgi:hypothetical protein
VLQGLGHASPPERVEVEEQRLQPAPAARHRAHGPQNLGLGLEEGRVPEVVERDVAGRSRGQTAYGAAGPSGGIGGAEGEVEREGVPDPLLGFAAASREVRHPPPRHGAVGMQDEGVVDQVDVGGKEERVQLDRARQRPIPGHVCDQRGRPQVIGDVAEQVPGLGVLGIEVHRTPGELDRLNGTLLEGAARPDEERLSIGEPVQMAGGELALTRRKVAQRTRHVAVGQGQAVVGQGERGVFGDRLYIGLDGAIEVGTAEAGFTLEVRLEGGD